MVRRIKHISEIPSWFQLDKYKHTKKLNAAEWYEQLIVRHDCLNYYVRFIKNLFKENGEAYDHIKKAFEFIRTNPIVDITSNEILRGLFYGGPLTEIKARKPNYTHAIHPMTMREFLLIEQNLIPERREYMQQWKNQFLKKGKCYLKKKRLPPKSWIHEPLYYSSEKFTTNAAITINLQLPDAVLIEHFKNFLTKIRTETYVHEVETSRKAFDFEDWCHLSVLPYLDLKIWEYEEDVTIPNRVMADAIYRTGEGGEEKVRKTTAPVADFLITETALEILCAQAANEITEGKARKNLNV